MYGYVLRVLRLQSTSLISCKHIRKINTYHQTEKVVRECDVELDSNKVVKRTKIDEETIAHLERLSLVDCANKQGIKILEDAIAFADKIQYINTDGVQPMYSVLEDEYLKLREDLITEGNCHNDILKNAAETEEGYFIAPPGNIPLPQRENLLHLEPSELQDNKD